jgi:protein-tyrosine phosphatase
MTQIWERLIIGGLADAEELAAGNPHGITTVISLSEIPVERKRRDISYVHLPIEDAEPIPEPQFGRILKALNENVRRGNVLLHCSQGVSRAPSMAAAYMASVGHREIDAALVEIRKLRPFVHPSSTLLKSIKENLR